MDRPLRDRGVDEHAAHVHDPYDPLARRYPVAGPDLPARRRGHELLVDDQAGAVRVDRAALDQVGHLRHPPARGNQPPLDRLPLRALLGQLQLGAPRSDGVRLLYQHVGPSARDDEIRRGGIELVPRAFELVAGDESLVEQRLQVLHLAAQPLNPPFRER